MHELKLMDVWKRYKDKDAVREVDYTFTNGVYGLLGENGAGKATLMRLICGLCSQRRERFAVIILKFPVWEQNIENSWAICRRILDFILILLRSVFSGIWRL